MPKVTLAAAVTLLAIVGLSQTEPESPKPAPRQSSKNKAATAERTIDKQEAARKQQALDLLKRSYALDEQVKPDARVGLLNTQIGVALKLDQELALAWAHELFDLGAKGQSKNGGTSQFIAVDAVAQINPDEALEMLALVDPSTVAYREGEFPGGNTAEVIPRTIFRTVARTKGAAAMPNILYAANTLGEKGRYPYSAVMGAVTEIKNEPLTTKTALQLLQRFQQGIDSDTAGFDFAEMLFETHRSWPKDLLKPAVDAAVEGVEKYPVNDKNKNFEMTISTAEGTTKAHGPIETGLLKIGSLIKEADPELWTALTKKYASLAGMPGDTFGHGITKISMGFGDPPPPSAPTAQDLKDDVLDEMRALLGRDDPEKAAKAMAQIQDPAIRAEALSYAARTTADRNPELSSQFAADAQKAIAGVRDVSIQFKAACARLQVDAVNKNSAAVPEDLDSAFQLADKVLRKNRDEGKDTGFMIEPLIDAAHEAIKIEPELTVAHIEMIYLPFEKAKMLTAAASVLASQDRPTHVSPSPKTEQASKQ